MTWKLVTMCPRSSQTKPEPAPRPRAENAFTYRFTEPGWNLGRGAEITAEHGFFSAPVAMVLNTGGTGVNDWWSNGNDQIAFGRGDRGFVVINHEGGSLTRTFQTGLAPGVYCDVVHGERAGSGKDQ